MPVFDYLGYKYNKKVSKMKELCKIKPYMQGYDAFIY